MAKSSSRRSKNVQPVPEPKPSSKAPSPSPSFSDSSMEDASNISEMMQPEPSYGYSASHPGSPTQLGALDTEDSVTCQWEDCGKVFTHLPTLIHHIHNGKFLLLWLRKLKGWQTPRWVVLLMNVLILLVYLREISPFL